MTTIASSLADFSVFAFLEKEKFISIIALTPRKGKISPIDTLARVKKGFVISYKSEQVRILKTEYEPVRLFICL